MNLEFYLNLATFSSGLLIMIAAIAIQISGKYIIIKSPLVLIPFIPFFLPSLIHLINQELGHRTNMLLFLVIPSVAFIGYMMKKYFKTSIVFFKNVNDAVTEIEKVFIKSNLNYNTNNNKLTVYLNPKGAIIRINNFADTLVIDNSLIEIIAPILQTSKQNYKLKSVLLFLLPLIIVSLVFDFIYFVNYF